MNIVFSTLYTGPLGNKIIASGGCKTAYDLGNGLVILMPNYEDFSKEIWDRIINEEIIISQQYDDLNLLTSNNTPATIRLINGNIINTYICRNFFDLKKDGIYIRDSKNDESTSWEGGLFQKNEDLEDIKRWKQLMNSFIDDIIILALHDYALIGDSFNHAVIQNETEHNIRPFCFDFSSKSYKRDLSIKIAQSKLDSYKIKCLKQRIKNSVEIFGREEMVKRILDIQSEKISNVFVYNTTHFSSEAKKIANELYHVLFQKLQKLNIEYELPLTKLQKEEENLKLIKMNNYLNDELAGIEKFRIENEKMLNAIRIKQEQLEKKHTQFYETIKPNTEIDISMQQKSKIQTFIFCNIL